MLMRLFRHAADYSRCRRLFSLLPIFFHDTPSIFAFIDAISSSLAAAAFLRFELLMADYAAAFEVGRQSDAAMIPRPPPLPLPPLPMPPPHYC